jgi:hypothetical protein
MTCNPNRFPRPLWRSKASVIHDVLVLSFLTATLGSCGCSDSSGPPGPPDPVSLMSTAPENNAQNVTPPS